MGRKRKKRKKTEVAIRRDDGSYEMKVAYGKYESKYVYGMLYAPSKETIMAKFYRWKKQYSNFELKKESLMPLKEWSMYWFENIKVPTLELSTRINYITFLNSYINKFLGDKALIKITSDDIERMIGRMRVMERSKVHVSKKRGLRDSTISEVLIVLKQILDCAYRYGYIAENPYYDVERVRGNKYVAATYNSDEIKRYLDVVQEDEYWSDFFHMAFLTGLRKGELCALKWCDYNEESGALYVNRSVKYYHKECFVKGTKTDAGTRTIILPIKAREILKKRRELITSAWIFPSKDSNEFPINPASIRDKHEYNIKTAGLRYIRFHDIRHTFATQSIINGVPIDALSGILGHSELTVTLITYAHNNMDLQRKVSEFTTRYAKSIMEEMKQWEN